LENGGIFTFVERKGVMKIIKSLFRIIVVGVISLAGFAELQTQTVPAGQGGSVTFFKPRP
jgi:hypothetical protein